MQCDRETQRNIQRAAKMFDEYGGMIRSVIHFHMNDGTEEDDIYQSFFLSLVYKPVPAGIQNVEGYLYRAVTNDIIDARRRIRSYRDRVQRFAKCLERDIIQEETPEDILSQAEEREKMFEIIEKQLPQHEAEAVIQRYRYGRSNHEAAKTMRVRERSFSRYLCMGLKKIRQIFAETKVDLVEPKKGNIR